MFGMVNTILSAILKKTPNSLVSTYLKSGYFFNDWLVYESFKTRDGIVDKRLLFHVETTCLNSHLQLIMVAYIFKHEPFTCIVKLRQ